MSPPPLPSLIDMLADSERTAVIDLARDAVTSAVLGGPAPEPPSIPVFTGVAGAFVTLTIAGELRGCIGQVEPRDSLGAVIVRGRRRARGSALSSGVAKRAALAPR